MRVSINRMSRQLFKCTTAVNFQVNLPISTTSVSLVTQLMLNLFGNRECSLSVNLICSLLGVFPLMMKFVITGFIRIAI